MTKDCQKNEKDNNLYKRNDLYRLVCLPGTITVSSHCAHRQGSDPDPVGRFFPDPGPSKKKKSAERALKVIN